MTTQPTLYDTANFFQLRANRTEDTDRKAHFQRFADKYRADGKAAGLDEQSERVQPSL